MHNLISCDLRQDSINKLFMISLFFKILNMIVRDFSVILQANFIGYNLEKYTRKTYLY